MDQSGMTVNVEEIVRERLAAWGKDCVEAHATPAMMLAIGHDNAQGEIHVLVPADDLFDRESVKALLRTALRALDSDK
jgi:hypothetical protein